MKLKKLITIFALALPLVAAPALTSVNSVHATTTKSTYKDYVLDNAKRYKKGVKYTAKNKSVTSYQGTFMADEPVVSLGNAKSVKLAKNQLSVDQKITVKVSNKSVNSLLKSKRDYKLAKNESYFHVKKIGWIKATDFAK